MPITETSSSFSIRFTGVLLAAVLALGGCDRALTDKDFVQKGKEAQERGQLAEAEIQLKNALQKNPDNVEARRRLGEVYVVQGKGKPAEEQLLRAKALGANPGIIAAPLGEAYLLQGLFRETMTSIQAGPDASPQVVARILEIRGRASLGLNDAEGGCRLFAQSLEVDPKYVPSYRANARCDIAAGNLDKARANLNKAFELDAKDSLTWVALGDLERAANRLTEADAAYTRAVTERPTDITALLSRAALRIETNKLAEASQDTQAALNLAPNLPLSHQLRGVVYYKQGKYAEAQTEFDSALRLDADYLPSIVWIGLTSFAQGNYEQAATRFAQFVRVIPSVRVQALLALTQAKMGSKSDADATLGTLRNVNVNDPQSLALLAQAHMTIGEVDPAEKYFKKAVEQKPDSAPLRVGLAETLSRKGQRTEAIQQLENAVRIDPGAVNGDVLLVQNLIREKQYDKALSAADALQKKNPKDATGFNLKGAVYLSQNDTVNARKNFEQAVALKPDSVSASLNLAQLDVADKKPDAARARLEKILEKDKQNVDAMLGLARIAGAAGRRDEYVSWLQRAAKAAPKAIQPRVMLAGYYLQQRDPKQAMEWATQAQSIAPDNAQALDALGSAQIMGGEKENALTTFRKLVAITPDNPVAHYKLAGVYAAMQNMSSARAEVTRALVLKPDYEEAQILLGFSELNAKRFTEAARIGQQIQQQHPNSASGYMLQGDALLADKKFAQAEPLYQKAVAINGNPLVAIRAHEAGTAAGHPKEADAALQRWLEGKPSDTMARSYFASALARSGQNAQAIEQMQKVVQLQPKNPAALNELALMYQRAGDSRALATAEQAQQLAPDRPEVLDTLGWMLVEQGQAARGVELLQNAASKAPNQPAIRYHLAAGLAKNGDKARAKREVETVLQDKSFAERADAERLLKSLQ